MKSQSGNTKTSSDNKNMVSLKAALAFCLENNYSLTKMGLRYTGKKYGFISKAEDGFHWVVDFEKLKEYVKKATEKIPEGWIPVKESIGEEVPIEYVYKWIKEGKIESRRYGPGKGKLYIKQIDLVE